jgi:hypothetical protein
MTCNFQDFIGVWDDFVPPQLCDDIVNLAERITQHNAHNSKFTGNGGNQFSVEGKTGRYDTQIYLTDYDSELCDEINHYLTTCISEYCEEYSHLKQINLASYIIKCQITPPSGGYHVWHYENMYYEEASRELVWSIYLNDMPVGEAETEFLYQKRRIEAKRGRVCIFPAGMTHVHRGNTVFTHNKYILTGWVNKVK